MLKLKPNSWNIKTTNPLLLRHHRTQNTTAKWIMHVLPGHRLGTDAGFSSSLASCFVIPSRPTSPAELRQLRVSGTRSDLVWLSCLLLPAAGFSLLVTLSDAWNDFVSEMGFFGHLSSSRTAEQLVLRKSNVAELAVRSRLRRLRFLRLFVCELTSASATAMCLVKAARCSFFVSLPTTVHFSSGFCPDFCRAPFPSSFGSLSQFFLREGQLCCSVVFVFPAKATQKHYHHVVVQQNTTYKFTHLKYCTAIKGELNLDNKWKSDDLFYIIMNKIHPRFNQFCMILKLS